jgi:hypothetical protein
MCLTRRGFPAIDGDGTNEGGLTNVLSIKGHHDKNIVTQEKKSLRQSRFVKFTHFGNNHVTPKALREKGLEDLLSRNPLF